MVQFHHLKLSIRTIVIIIVMLLACYHVYNLAQEPFNQPTPQRRTNHFEISKECLQTNTSTSTQILNEGVALIRVVDGDTIDIQRGCGQDRVRLIGINTPETVDPRRPVQCFGKEATEHITKLLEDKHIRVEGDKTQTARDIYNRLLAYVVTTEIKNLENIATTSTSTIEQEPVSEEINVNGQMIKDGYAYEYTYKIPYAEQKRFKEYQRTAQKNLIGLWSPETCNGKK